MPLFLLSQRDPLKSANFLAVFSSSDLISANSIFFTSKFNDLRLFYMKTVCKQRKRGDQINDLPLLPVLLCTSTTVFELFAATARANFVTSYFHFLTSRLFLHFFAALFRMNRLAFCYFLTF